MIHSFLLGASPSPYITPYFYHPLIMTAHDQHATGIAEIATHEERELARLAQTKAMHASEESRVRSAYAEKEKDAETRAREAAMRDLRAFEEAELPQMIREGDHAIEVALREIDTLSARQAPSVRDFLLQSIQSGTLAL